MYGNICSTKESLTLDGNLKQVAREVAEDIKLTHPEVYWTKRYKTTAHSAGCEPDGGVFWFDDVPIVVAEAKHQGNAGNAIERWYKNNYIIKMANADCTYITFATGEGAYPDRMIGKILSPAHHLGYNNYCKSENVCYLRPEGVSEQEMYSILIQAINDKVSDYLR